MLSRQLGAFLYKSWLVQRRKWLWTLTELLLPLALTGTLVAVNFIATRQIYADRIYEPIVIKGDFRDLTNTVVDKYTVVGLEFAPTDIYYAPNTSIVKEVMRKLRKKLTPVRFWTENGQNCDTYDDLAETADNVYSTYGVKPFEDFATAEELESVLYQKLLSTFPPSFYAGIVFSDDFAQGRNMTNVHYQLRFTYEQRNIRPDDNVGTFVYTWSTENDFSDDHNNLNINPNSSDGGKPNYWREGFLTLQRALDMILIENMVPDSLCTLLNTTVAIQRFPFPSHVAHPLIALLPFLLPAVLMLSFVVSVLYMTRSLTVEKEAKLVEYVGIITGLNPLVQTFAHFVLNFFKLFFIVVLITLMLSFTVFEKSNGFLIGFFLFLYMLNAIAFAFTVAIFFDTVNNATLCSGALWFLLYIPCFYLQSKMSTLQKSQVVGFAFLPNAAVVVFSQLISSLESQGAGLQWTNMFVVPFTKSKFAVYECYLMLFASFIPPMIIRVLYEIHEMNKNGDFRFSSNEKRSSNQSMRPMQFDWKKIESHPHNMQASISLENANKTFPNGRLSQIKALNNLCLNIFPGELTVILGHNGAGKSTLMNILTGITRLDDGTAYVQNFDVDLEMHKIRKIIGYCPQYNMLFEQLTVLEHLQFFSQLKGLPYDSGKAQWLLTKLSLFDKRHDFAKHLSGGQKRRLCLAIALINGSKIVLLDEATSGMDPGAKGDILEVIKREKQFDRTFVLVTHYVDEAETLGDRISILANGQLKCSGTNMFLKNRFGNGYRLNLKFQHTINENLQLMVDKILSIIQDFCPGSALVHCTGGEARYILRPLCMTDCIDCSSLCQLLATLERLQSHLPIESISISMPTMQDVFMNTCADDKLESRDKKDRTNNVFLKSERFNEGFVLFVQQLRACLIKRALHTWRRRIIIFVQYLVLFVTVGGSMILSNLLSGYKPKPPPKNLTIHDYDHSTLLLSYNSDNDYQQRLVDNLQQLTMLNGLSLNEPQLSDDNMSRYILDRSRKTGVIEFMESSYIGLVFENIDGHVTSNLTGLFNNRAVHSAAVAVNLVDNLILKTFCPRCSISTANYPLPQTTVLYFSFGEDFVLVLCLAVGFALFLTSFSAALVDERSNGSKHMQILAGLHPGTYWLATFMWDIPFYSVTALFIVLIWYLGGCMLLIDEGAWFDMVLLLLLHGWSMLPVVYVLSMVFNNPAGAATVITALNLLLNLMPTLVSTTLSVLSVNDPSLVDVEKTFTKCLTTILPQFALSKSIMTYYSNRLMRKQCKAMKACDYLQQIQSDHFKITQHTLEWDSPGIGRYLTCLTAQGFVLLALLACIEWFNVVRRNRDAFTSRPNSAMSRPSSPKTSECVLDAQEVVVRYSNRQVPAVNNLSFRVRRGEIFGLNGQNGSGKSSTYKILTGQLRAAHGNAFINGVDTTKDWRAASRFIGFCPQVDSLIEHLTAVECLVHFARIKGIPEMDIEDIVHSLLNAVGLNLYSNRIVKTFSGGNKRKLSLALALIGAPPLILLDEPTCGVDPSARRKIWKLLQLVKKLGCGIVLTSHDMEECEFLCNRLMIMVNGRVKTIGTPQSLLDEYKTAYSLKLTVDSDTDLQSFQECVQKLFHNAELKGQPNQCQFHFAVPMTEDVSWACLFKNIEILKQTFDITDFSLSQPSLQEAFVAITKSVD